MVTKDIAMHTLTAEERKTLIETVTEIHGMALGQEAFADAMWELFEDIPGFETIKPTQAKRLIHTLWSTYHGQETQA